jgi:progressive ankylosis protein
VLQRAWPLAASWLLTTGELVVVAGVIARLPDAPVQLAAWGVVFAVATIIQAPSSAFLPVSTALSIDRVAYAAVWRHALPILIALSAIHAALVLTPLHPLLFAGLLGLPEPVVAAARLPLIALLPWTFGTGARRLLHGPLIRAGYARVAIWGSALRLGVGATLLTLGARAFDLPGATLAASAVIAGVIAETLLVAWRARVLLPRRLPEGPTPAAAPVTRRRFTDLLLPLVGTALLTMGVQVLISGVLSRLPRPLESLAVWPVVFSFLVLFQAPGLAYTEVVISLARRAGAARALARATLALALLVAAALAIALLTPLARLWFGQAMGLPPALAAMAIGATLLSFAIPPLRVLASHRHRRRARRADRLPDAPRPHPPHLGAPVA